MACREEQKVEVEKNLKKQKTKMKSYERYRRQKNYEKAKKEKEYERAIN